MTHTYSINGMTCNGCVAHVKNALLKLGGISAVDVDLADKQATISMDHHIATPTLQQVLGTKYIITEQAVATNEDTATDNPSYYPILLIFGYITGITLLLQMAKGGFSFGMWMQSFMAGFFLLFSMFKLLNLGAFADGYSTYDIIARKVRPYGYIYPFIELLLGVAYLTGFQPLATNLVTFVVMGISTIGVVQSLVSKRTFQCACLGTIIKLPLSKVTLFEDLLMIAMSATMIVMSLKP